MSSPTTHSARSSCATTARPIDGAPTAGAARARTTAMRAIAATYSVVAWPAVGRVCTTPIGRPGRSSPPGDQPGGERHCRSVSERSEERGERGARVAGHVEERLGVDAERDGHDRADDGDEHDL